MLPIVATANDDNRVGITSSGSSPLSIFTRKRRSKRKKIMRLDSLLFVAILFACLNTSSTRSSTTSVEPTTSNQKDVPDHEFGGETTKEERAFNLPGFDKTIEGINSMASKFVEKMLYWILRASEKNAVEAYTFLRLDKDNSIRLRNARYKAWVRYLDKATDTLPAIKSAITRLSGRHGDKGLLKMLEALIKANTREDIQAKLESALMASWKGKSAKDVFELLKLDQETDDPLYVKRLKVWVEYVKKSSDPDSKMKFVIAGYDDRVRAMILNGLREIDGTGEVVKPLLDSLASFFKLNRPTLSADAASTALRPDKAGENLFSDPKFDIWVKYAAKETEVEKIPKSTIDKVSKLYGDGGLLKMFEVFAKAEASEAVLTSLESALMASWKGKSAKDVFELLKLDQETDDPLYVKRLKVWVEYVKKSSDPDSKMKFVIAGYDVRVRAMILDGLREIDGTGEVVKPLLDSLASFFKLNRPTLSADAAFTALRLDKAGENLFSDPKFDIWVKYAAKETEVEKIPKSTIDKVSKLYGDGGLLKMFEVFAKAEASKAVLTELESALMASWKGKSAKDVFELLKLNQKLEPKHSVNVILLRLWVQYVKKNLAMPNIRMKVVIDGYELDVRVNILGGLRQIDGTESVVENLKKLLVKDFKERNISFEKDQVVQVFNDLKLGDDLDTFFLHQNLDLFNEYAAKFEPDIKKKVSLIIASREVYKDVPLGTMLNAVWSKKDENFNVVLPLRNELFRQWLVEGKNKQLNIKGELEGQLLWSYEGYVEAQSYEGRQAVTASTSSP